MGIQQVQLCLQLPSQPTAGSPLKLGNTLVNRLLVPDKALRLRLAAFAGTGILSQEVQALRDALMEPAAGPHGKAVAGLLTHTETASGVALGALKAARPYRQVISCLATTAPADNLLPQILWPQVESLLLGRALSVAEISQLRLSAMLARFLQPLLHAGPLPSPVRAFLDSLLQVC